MECDTRLMQLKGVLKQPAQVSGATPQEISRPTQPQPSVPRGCGNNHLESRISEVWKADARSNCLPPGIHMRSKYTCRTATWRVSTAGCATSA